MQTVPTIYNGRDNTIDLAITEDNTPISADFVTGVSVNVYDKKYGALVQYIEGRAGEQGAQPGLFDFTQSQVVPGGGPVPLRIITMMLGRANPRIPARGTSYWVEVVLWSQADPDGINWVQFACAVDAESPVSP